ncbi:KH domain-containing protein akap-1 [Cimex lectularius]|uniref:Tudor domain-containing protein n=1 Tax=Cimex lectularius TaxID=79782 RepID=A0A8I6TIL4_CIMLE|nr:KH domain-containing protein akap-1 [Cimex lectularius]XP_014252449.1 KH domain-containing protein akap-1 [Cimex lectularius]XP_014252450.1 KH domain-containing protein akap-1 [Cimex lectularius]XP_024081183.1 KH domain-containing protein akap-1 [Cimex lectularius]
MPRGSTRELLILSLPTLAILIGVFWLKRHRRRRDTHTDPGGTTDNTPNSCKPEELEVKPIEKDSCQNLKFAVPPKETLDVSVEEKFLEEIITADQARPDDIVKSGESPVEVEEFCVKSLALPSVDLSLKSIEETFDKSETLISSAETSAILSLEEKSSTLEDSVIAVLDKNDKCEVLETSELEEGEIVSSEEEEKEETEIVNPSAVDQRSEQSDSNFVQTRPDLEEGELESSSTENSFVKEKSEPLGKEENMKKVAQGDLADKLVNLELDSMKIRDEKQKENTERDSANHSPSEVMLASPSISNFSDAHSEGSSDSGKGHSDVATSPSRTPAGGSSLAGDLATLSLYEFVLPQVIVGRLIGRHGAFLHEIRTSTQTNIFIKRHPDTNKLKICAIEGTQQDIDKALAKIRQKFPLRRFPQLTLEKVSFVTLNNYPPLKMEDFHLQLVEGVNNDVILSSLISAAHFFLQQPSHPTYGSLSALNQIMNQVYSTDEAPVLESPVKDAICAAPTSGGWYRAQIIDVDEENSTSTVRFLDYGGYLLLASSNLRQIRGDLLNFPFQAVECYLANVKPIDEEGWSEEAKLFVQSLTLGQILQAQIYDYAEDCTPLVYLYTSNGQEVVLVNEELVLHGYGTLTTVPEE